MVWLHECTGGQLYFGYFRDIEVLKFFNVQSITTSVIPSMIYMLFRVTVLATPEAP